MLAICNKDGIAPVTAGGLARLANITPEKALDALNILSSPDPDTLTQDNEGRRIERCSTGWRLLNFSKYREMAKSSILREQNRLAQERFREKQVAEDKPFVKPNIEQVAAKFIELGVPVSEAAKFIDFYGSKDWKVGKNPMKSWEHAVGGWASRYLERNQPKNVDHKQTSEGLHAPIL